VPTKGTLLSYNVGTCRPASLICEANLMVLRPLMHRVCGSMQLHTSGQRISQVVLIENEIKQFTLWDI